MILFAGPAAGVGFEVAAFVTEGLLATLFAGLAVGFSEALPEAFFAGFSPASEALAVAFLATFFFISKNRLQ